MNCFMFPGQPLSFAPSLPDDRDFAEIAQLTRENAFLDLASLSWNKGEPSENVKLQVYGTAMSLYQNRSLLGRGIRPKVIAEHSMGIYPALAAAGVISEAEALQLTYRIGLCFARMAQKGPFALGCIIGLTREPLSAIAANNGTHLANLNTSRHFLLSGSAHGMTGTVNEALAAGAFSAKLFPSDAPLHSPLMAELASPLAEICSGFRYREPALPIINHIDQKPLAASEIGRFLVDELFAPVYWEESYLALYRMGVRHFFEVGSGDSLKKYNRWIDNEKIPR